MKSVWATLGVFGGVCFLTMGLPLLLAVGLVGLVSTSVWLPLLAAVIGVGGLAASMVRSGRCQRCASASEAPESNLRLMHSTERDHEYTR